MNKDSESLKKFEMTLENKDNKEKIRQFDNIKNILLINDCLISSLSGSDLLKLGYIANNGILLIRTDNKLYTDDINIKDIDSCKFTEYDNVNLCQYINSIVNYRTHDYKYTKCIYTCSDIKINIYCNEYRYKKYIDKILEQVVSTYDVEIDYIF